MPRHLLLLETSGNQAFVYGSNKLRENIGASELTYRATTSWLAEAAGFRDAPVENPAEFRRWVASRPQHQGARIILATSGKALLVVEDATKARQIIGDVTVRAALEAPGLSLTGAVTTLDEADGARVHDSIRRVHERFNANRDLMPVPSPRFAMLPYCVPCGTSGLPAVVRNHEGNLSAVASAKRACAADWFKRVRSVLAASGEGMRLAAGIDELEDDFADLGWLGVVYSDGNGLGQVMLEFDRWLEPGDDYLATLNAFSVELDEATESAFISACGRVAATLRRQDDGRGARRLPIVPVLMGGDDLTALVDGRFALPFAKAFLEAFERESANRPTLRRIAGKALGAACLSAGAGVAIVKPHFPFHSAHSLAEDLLRSAKQVKSQVRHRDSGRPIPCSSLDFHVLFDASYSSLEDIRQTRRRGSGGERLWAGPYVVSEPARFAEAASPDWAGRHHLSHLLSRIEAIRARREDGSPRLPSGPLHMLRESLSQGRPIADARLAELAWLSKQGLDRLIENPGSLFDGESPPATRFLDALASADLWSDEGPMIPPEAHP